jgi:Escherichia/Staphylococcus phage prohead protease
MRDLDKLLPDAMERYQPGPVELREGDPAKGDPGKPPMVTGYASVFNIWAVLFDGPDPWFPDQRLLIREQVVTGAFDSALSEAQDVRALVNHDSSLLLGRTRSGTLRLTADPVGLFYACDLPDTSAGRDVAVSIKRGDMTGSSFGFKVRENGQRRTVIETDELYQVDRELLDLDLLDVSPVTYPAYASTSTAIRSQCLGAILAEVEAERNCRGRLRRSVRQGQRLRLTGALISMGPRR